MILRSLKHWWQRQTRGFDDAELWNLNTAIAEFVLPRLKAFRELPPMSTPCRKSEKQWAKILDEMIDGFEAMGQEVYDKNTQPCIDRGMLLFGRWFLHLWD